MSMLWSSWEVCLIAAGDIVQAETWKQQRRLRNASAKRGRCVPMRLAKCRGECVSVCLTTLQ